MKKPKIIIISLISCIITLSIVQVIISNMFSPSGVSLDNIQKEIKVLKNENLMLSEKLLELSSLHNIASSAATLGFVETKSRVYLSAPVPLAIR